MAKRTILVTGSTGMLGANFVRVMSANPAYEVYGLSRTISPLIPPQNQLQVDLQTQTSIDSGAFKPDVIIHAAALTNLSQCERNPTLAARINVEGTRVIARLAGKNTLFFYISTDSIFDGKKGSYLETDKPNPLNVYARTKLFGEAAALQENIGDTCIIRTNIYGFHVPQGNSLAEWAQKQWAQGNTIVGFEDVIFNAVYTNQLVELVQYLLAKDMTIPVLNVGSEEKISKYDFLLRFMHTLGLKDTRLLRRGRSADITAEVQRPLNTSLNCNLLSNFFPGISFTEGMIQWKQHATRHGIITNRP